MSKKNPIDGFLSRTVDFVPEERSDGKGKGRKMSGYAAVFNQDTPIRSWEGTFNERIAPGAFKKTLAERQPVMQFDHGRDSRFGSLPIGNFTTVREDAKGLYVEGDLFEHAAPIAEAIRSGAVTGMSFKFGVVRDEWHDKNGVEITSKRELQDMLWGDSKDVHGNERGPLQRTIKEVRLAEAGPVVFPAYPQTSVGVRSLDDTEKAELMEIYGRNLPDGDEAPEAVASREGEEVTPEQADEAPGADTLREEVPDDAAQAGTSTGMSMNARERFMALNEI
jgi:HK97 family phage prohead protease